MERNQRNGRRRGERMRGNNKEGLKQDGTSPRKAVFLDCGDKVRCRHRSRKDGPNFQPHALCKMTTVKPCFSAAGFNSHSNIVPGKYFLRTQYCVRAQSADCALTKYCFPAKFASSQNILSRHCISIFLYFVPTQYCVGR